MATLQRGTRSALDLVEAYDPLRHALFSSPRRTVLAVGNRLEQPGVPGREIAAVAAELLRSTGAGVALAAVPFDLDGLATLVVPHERHVVEGPRATLGLDGARPAAAPVNGHANGPVNGNGSRWSVAGVPSRDAYAAAVRDALGRIGVDGSGDPARPHVDKVVLARTLELTGGGPVDPAAIVRRLAARDAGTYTFGIALPPVDGEPRHLVGASPELLVSRDGTRVVSRALAGSATRSADPVVDRARGAALLLSDKDVAEHAFVVDGVRAALEPYCRDLVVADRPSLVATATVWHLQTEVSGVLRDPATTSLELALALHPTPAVCGTPTDAARDAIGALEGFDRGSYAGLVGWLDEHGDGEWAITIRCAELRPSSLRLYAGAGIVAGSEPAAEVAETSAKFRTMLEAMGLDDDA